MQAHTVFGQLSPAFSFTHYGMENGLASNEIFSITQDRTGYIWIATNNGLQRYDGVHFKTFRHLENDSTSLPENIIRNLHVDKNNNLWIATENGHAGMFDQNRFTYHDVPVKPRRKLTMIPEKRLIEDNEGNMFYLLRGEELCQYIKEKNEFSAADNFIPLDAAWGITTMSQQPGTQKYWIGLQNGGLLIYNRKTKQSNYLGHNPENEPAVERIGTKVFANSMFDQQGRFWFDHWDIVFPYVMYYDLNRPADSIYKTEFLSTLKEYNETNGFIQQRNGRIWVRGAQVFGWFDETEKRFHLIPKNPNNEHGIIYQTLTWIYEDREHNIWAGTSDNGLYRFNPSREYFINIRTLNPHTGLPGNAAVMSFIETKNGDVITGTWGQGPMRYNQQLQPVPLNIQISAEHSNPSIWNMCASADSNIIWMGCQPGLYTYDQAKGVMMYRNPKILKNKTVRQVVEDKKGNLWLGQHYGSVYKWIHPKNFKKDSIMELPEPKGTQINKILLDNRGTLWIGTREKGLYRYDIETGSLLHKWNSESNVDEEMPGNVITSLLEYNDSLLIISNNSNLFWYNQRTQQFSLLRLPMDLMGTVSSLQKDNAGFIWISTTNALYRYQIKYKSLLFFNRRDGIINDRFDADAAYKMKDGRLLFGTTNSTVAVQPSDIRLSKIPPVVAITGIEVGKKELRLDSVMALKQLKLSYKENSIIVDFSAMSFLEDYIIQYKMESIDEEWHLAEEDNRAAFPILPPGHYTLLLRTLNAEGSPSTQTTSLRIYIQPPFYRTWWFYLLVAIAFGCELYWLDKQRNMRKKGLQKVRTDISNNLHKEINEALNNINILSEIARLKSDKEPHKAKEYLEQIHAKSNNMIIAMDDMLWSLDPGNDSMIKTINRLKEFIDALRQRHGVQIQLHVDKNVEQLSLNMKQRHEAFLLFKEGLQSLVTAGSRKYDMHLTCEKNKLFFTIEFENENCDMQQLSNLLHRRDLEQRLQAIGAKLDVQKHRNNSMFLLQLPLG